ncbi:hypothetical protein HJFPF1_10710 [Paramyrothecium foliicola]|nr:hypothetical protein HJFPF1_10710 [Paramyrothecium foliicola]
MPPGTSFGEFQCPCLGEMMAVALNVGCRRGNLLGYKLEKGIQPGSNPMLAHSANLHRHVATWNHPVGSSRSLTQSE